MRVLRTWRVAVLAGAAATLLGPLAPISAAPPPASGTATLSGDTFSATGTVRARFASSPLEVDASLHASWGCSNSAGTAITFPSEDVPISVRTPDVTVVKGSKGSSSWSASVPSTSGLFSLACSDPNFPNYASGNFNESINNATITVGSQPPQGLQIL